MKRNRLQRAFGATLVLLMVLMTSAIVYAGVVAGPGNPGMVKNPSGTSTLPKVVKQELTIDHAYGTYFAPVKLKATLKTGNTGVNNSEISFFVDGKLVGKAQTGTAGIAHLDYTVPASLKAGSEIRAEGAGLVAKNTIGLIKRATTLSVGVGTDAMDMKTSIWALEGERIIIGGRLTYNTGVYENTAGRTIRVKVGNETYTAPTQSDRPGEFWVVYIVPTKLNYGSTIAVQAFFDGDNDCCLQGAASNPAAIMVGKVKPAAATEKGK